MYVKSVQGHISANKVRGCLWTVWLSAAALSISCPPTLAAIEFVDVTTSSGIGHTGASYGASWGDFNGDGLADLWVGNHYTPPSLYRNNGNGTFSDVVSSVWPGPVRDTHGAAWADFDRDGDQDLIEVVGGANSNQLWLNNSGVFVDVAPLQGVDTPGARSRTPLWLDWDRDGYLDLVLTHALGNGTFPFVLRNTGSGFEDATATVGAPLERTTSAYLSDLTEDGALDLALLVSGSPQFPGAVYDISSIPFILRPDLSNGGGAVSDAVFADFNGDLRTDIFATRGAGPQQLAVRSSTEIAFSIGANSDEKAVSFETTGPINVSVFPGATSPSLLVGQAGQTPAVTPTPELSFGSFLVTLDPQDMINHGIAPHTPGEDEGIYIGYDAQLTTWTIALTSPASKSVNFVVTSPGAIQNAQAIGFQASPALPWPSYFMRTDTGFEERRSQSGLATGMPCFSVVSGDFDNDMDVDLYLACTLGVSNVPNILLENLGNGSFTFVPNAGGASGSLAGKAGNVVTADYDQDGFLDLFVANGAGAEPFNGGPHQLFQNVGNLNKWIELDLIGDISSPHGIGAIVKVTAGGKTQVREQNGGTHTESQNFQRLHFGLGNNDLIEQIEVLWPSGITQILTNIPSNQILSIMEQDQDGDGVSDSIDNCPNISNSYQSDIDNDSQGDACEAPEANGFWLDFDNPDAIAHIYGLYFHLTDTQVFFGDIPAMNITVLDTAHIVATVPDGQPVGPITVITPNGSDSTPSNAALIDRGGGLIYDTELNITWLQDTNYASTQGFDDDGLMTWPVAMSWAASLGYYDSVRNKTWNDWRLPSALNQDGSGPCFGLNCFNSELGHLYYIDQIKRASPGPFKNHKIGSYWSRTGRAPLPGTAWLFTTGIGKQDFTGPLEEILVAYAWVVRDGDVAGSVPFANNDSFTVTKGQSANLILALNDIGTDDGLNLASISIINGPSNGRIESINAEGSVDYRHNGSDTVSDSFTYTINDVSTATSNVASVGILVRYPNQAPVANDDNGAVNESDTVNINLAANDSDFDSGLDLASIRLTSKPTNGSVTVNKDGTVDYTEITAGATSDSFTYVISDLSGAISNTAMVTINVDGATSTLIGSSGGGGGGGGGGCTLNAAACQDSTFPLLMLVMLSYFFRGTFRIGRSR